MATNRPYSFLVRLTDKSGCIGMCESLSGREPAVQESQPSNGLLVSPAIKLECGVECGAIRSWLPEEEDDPTSENR